MIIHYTNRNLIFPLYSQIADHRIPASLISFKLKLTQALPVVNHIGHIPIRHKNTNDADTARQTTIKWSPGRKLPDNTYEKNTPIH